MEDSAAAVANIGGMRRAIEDLSRRLLHNGV